MRISEEYPLVRENQYEFVKDENLACDFVGTKGCLSWRIPPYLSVGDGFRGFVLDLGGPLLDDITLLNPTFPLGCAFDRLVMAHIIYACFNVNTLVSL